MCCNVVDWCRSLALMPRLMSYTNTKTKTKTLKTESPDVSRPTSPARSNGKENGRRLFCGFALRENNVSNYHYIICLNTSGHFNNDHPLWSSVLTVMTKSTKHCSNFNMCITKYRKLLCSVLLTYNVVICVFEGLNNLRIADFILHRARQHFWKHHVCTYRSTKQWQLPAQQEVKVIWQKATSLPQSQIGSSLHRNTLAS